MSNLNGDIENFFSFLLSGTEDTDGKFVHVSFMEDGQPTVKFSNGKTQTMLETMGVWNTEPGRNIYWSAGLRRQSLPEGQRGGEADITKMLAIVVDIDDPDAAQDAGQKAQAMGIIPTFVIRTSKTPTERKQLVYVLSEPTDDLDAWRVAARKLEYYFGGDFCSKDAAHVWRVPGSMNWPNAKKREAGRVPEISELVYESGRTYELDAFDDLPEPPQSAVEPVEVKPLDVAGASRKWGRMEEMLGFLPGWLAKEMFTPQQDRSEFDFKLAKEFIKAGEGLNSADYLLLYHLAHPTYDFTGKWREKEAAKVGAGDAYLARTWARATAGVSVEDECETAEDMEEEDCDDFIWSPEEINDLEVPPAHYLVKPFVLENAIHLIHAPTGHGKSHFAQHVTYALACGKPLPPFSITEPKRVLYVDGEMGIRTIKKRLANLVEAYGDAEGRFKYFTPLTNKKTKGKILNLNLLHLKDRQLVARAAMRHKADVIVLDNVRTLAPGMTENDAEAWAEWNNFLVMLRSYGFTVIWVHHDKKGYAKEEGDYGGDDYSGSTNALTTTEVQVQIKKCGKDKIEQIADEVKRMSLDGQGYPTKYLTNLVEMKYGKLRDGDITLHKDIKLMFVNETAGKNCTRMYAYADQDVEYPGLAQLTRDEKCWALRRGTQTIMKMSLRDAAKKIGISHTLVAKSAKKVADRITKIGTQEEMRLLALVDHMKQI